MTHRLFWPLLFTLLAGFTAIILAIRAQPFDAADLRALLVPTNCPAPCFLGIRPGITTVDNALAILENHAWVTGVDAHFISPRNPTDHYQGWVYWDWKADAPVWFRSASNVLRGHAGVFDTLDGLVVDITIVTNIPFGSIRLALGKPSGYGLSFTNVIISKGVFRSASLRYRDAYLDRHIQTEAISLCQDTAQVWFKPSAITFFDSRQTSELAEHLMNEHPFLSELDLLKHRICLGR
jgi:hypothetical protein